MKRSFFSFMVLIVLLFLPGIILAQPLKFGIISDVHQDIMHDAKWRLQTFIDEAIREKVDFIIELGDFCQAREVNRDFLNVWNSFQGDSYHVLGNHDMDCDGGMRTKEDYMKFVGMPGRYYSFDKGDFHFIVLDPNNLLIHGEYVSCRTGSGYGKYIDPEQILWLKKDLASTKRRCILFSHQSLILSVENREEIRGILEGENRRCGFKKVILAFCGHHHSNCSEEINGITYIQHNSASNRWGGDKYICTKRFSKKINDKYPWLKYTFPYKDPLYSIVTLEKNHMDLKGKTSTFIPPTPKDMGIPDTFRSTPTVAYIKDMHVEF